MYARARAPTAQRVDASIAVFQRATAAAITGKIFTAITVSSDRKRARQLVGSTGRADEQMRV